MTDKLANEGAKRHPLWDGFKSAYEGAKRPDLQAFPLGLSYSNAFNAAPYVVSLDQFLTDFDTTVRRHSLAEQFVRIINRLAELGCSAQYALVGGSYIDITNAEPKDMDSVVFYSHDALPSHALKSLQALHAEAHDSGLDIRFISLDMHPVVLAKITGFFSILYSQNRKGGGAKPCVIVNLAP